MPASRALGEVKRARACSEWDLWEGSRPESWFPVKRMHESVGGAVRRRGVVRTRNDDLELVRKLADPLVGFLELVERPAVGHITSMNEHITVGDVL